MVMPPPAPNRIFMLEMYIFISAGLSCFAILVLSVSSLPTGNNSAQPRHLLKWEQQLKDSPSLLSNFPALYFSHVRVKRQPETNNSSEVDGVSNDTAHDVVSSNAPEGSGADNVTSPEEHATASPSGGPSTSAPNEAVSTEPNDPNILDELATTTDTEVSKTRYDLPTLPPFDHDLVQDLPERKGEDEAIVETRPNLLHPFFTTYILVVTIPCVVGWCLLTFACLWICRPNSPLYREILKRLIEHSQMKQKSVLFSATLLAADKGPPPSTGEGTSKA